MNWLKVIMILLQSGPELMEQITQIIAFLEELLGKFGVGEVSTMEFSEVDAMLDKYPAVQAMCDEINDEPGAQANGAFLRFLLENLNAQKIRDLIKLFIEIRDAFKPVA